MIGRVASKRSDTPWLALVAAVNFAVVLTLFETALTRFPNTGDEHSLLFQAKIFSGFRLAAPIPPLPAFFSSHWMYMMNGHWFSMYPPGAPLLFTPGIWLGYAPLIPALLSSLLLLLLFHVSLRLSGDRAVAWIATLGLALSPTFLFHSASYYTHVPLALTFLFTITRYVRWRESVSFPAAAALGLSAGFCVWIRPYSGALLVVPLFVAALMECRSGGRDGRRSFTLATGVGLLMLAALPLYNGYLTGDPLQWPYLSRVRKAGQLRAALPAKAIRRLADTGNLTLRWMPAVTPVPGGNLKAATGSTRAEGALWILGILAGAFLALRRKREVPLNRAWIAGASCLIVGFLFFGARGGRFGERYLFEAVPVAIYLMATAVAALWARLSHLRTARAAGIAVGLAAVSTTVHGVVGTSRYLRRDNQVRMSPYEMTEQRGIRDALIFLESVPHFDPTFYTRNEPDLRGNVFVLARGPENRLLAERFPRRKVYVYARNDETRRFEFRPDP